jgi:hypothetical protein
MFAQTIDEPAAVCIDEGVVDGGAAEIDSSNDGHGRIIYHVTAFARARRRLPEKSS